MGQTQSLRAIALRTLISIKASRGHASAPHFSLSRPCKYTVRISPSSEAAQAHPTTRIFRLYGVRMHAFDLSHDGAQSCTR